VSVRVNSLAPQSSENAHELNFDVALCALQFLVKLRFDQIPNRRVLGLMGWCEWRIHGLSARVATRLRFPQNVPMTHHSSGYDVDTDLVR
jgi:hypothetical protein